VAGKGGDAMKIPRGRPVFADDQRSKILDLLREAGPRGVRRDSLIFEHRYTQCGTRIFELDQQGYIIRHESRPGEQYVTYVLEGEPLELKPLPAGADWYECEYGPRPSEKSKVPTTDLRYSLGRRVHDRANHSS
jgi:hypothetical protein